MLGRSFYVLLSGRVITNIGDSIYAIAAMLLVYQLSGSSFYTGLAGFLTMAPQALQFLYGPIVDRLSHYWILILNQLLQGGILCFIPILYYFDFLTVWVVLTVMPIMSAIQQLTYPTQYALVPKIVKEEKLVRANSLMNITYQSLDIILTGISGIFITIVGMIAVFWIDAIFFMMAALLFSFLRINKSSSKMKRGKGSFRESILAYKNDLFEGCRSVQKSIIPKFLLASAVANFMIGSLTAVLPEFTSDRGGAHLYGFYLGGLSAGLLLGALAANFFERFPIGVITIVGFALSGFSWISAGFIENNLISLVMFSASYITIGMTNVIFIAVIQQMVPSSHLGRVFSLIASMTGIAAPLGSLIGGGMATVLNSTIIFVSGGVGLLFVAAFWIIRKPLRNFPSKMNLSAAYHFKVAQVKSHS